MRSSARSALPRQARRHRRRRSGRAGAHRLGTQQSLAVARNVALPPASELTHRTGDHAPALDAPTATMPRSSSRPPPLTSAQPPPRLGALHAQGARRWRERERLRRVARSTSCRRWSVARTGPRSRDQLGSPATRGLRLPLRHRASAIGSIEFARRRSARRHPSETLGVVDAATRPRTHSPRRCARYASSRTDRPAPNRRTFHHGHRTRPDSPAVASHPVGYRVGFDALQLAQPQHRGDDGVDLPRGQQPSSSDSTQRMRAALAEGGVLPTALASCSAQPMPSGGAGLRGARRPSGRTSTSRSPPRSPARG